MKWEVESWKLDIVQQRLNAQLILTAQKNNFSFIKSTFNRYPG